MFLSTNGLKSRTRCVFTTFGEYQIQPLSFQFCLLMKRQLTSSRLAIHPTGKSGSGTTFWTLISLNLTR